MAPNRPTHNHAQLGLPEKVRGSGPLLWPGWLSSSITVTSHRYIKKVTEKRLTNEKLISTIKEYILSLIFLNYITLRVFLKSWFNIGQIPIHFQLLKGFVILKILKF